MRKGLLIHPEEMSRRWADRAADLGLDVLGFHPVGGGGSYQSLKALTDLLKTAEFRGLVDYAISRGLEIEYEMHAASFLLDRELFGSRPELFRMDKDGNRVPDKNFCVSNEETMEIVAKRAVELADLLYGSTDRYYFWVDDGGRNQCFCEKCGEYSASDLQLMIINRMLTEIRTVKPNAKMAYLAYGDSLEVPTKVKPVDGIFYEYAPVFKYIDKNCQKWEADCMWKGLELFGRKDAKVLEYWTDNSMFSQYTKPPKKMTIDHFPIRDEVRMYHDAGFDSITAFACYLGEDYYELYGDPDLEPYKNAFTGL